MEHAIPASATGRLVLQPGRVRPPTTRSRRWVTAAVLAAVIAGVTAEGAFAQFASVQYQVAFDRELTLGLFSDPVIQMENGPGPGDATLAFSATDANGVLTIAGTLAGYHSPLIALNQRQLDVTGLTASVAPGELTPLGSPNHTIELVACYRFPMLPVGPPHFFGTHLDGFFTNVAGPANAIDFARVQNQPYDLTTDVCPEPTSLASPLTLYSFVAPVLTLPSVEFNSGQINFRGPSQSGTVAIAHYFKFTLRQDGDAVFLPGSAVAMTSEQGPDVPTLSEVGLIVLLAALLFTGMAIVVRGRVV